MRKYGERMSFSGGAENTLSVQVSRHNCPGSLHDGDITLRITQGEEQVHISPDTFQSILDWLGHGQSQ